MLCPINPAVCVCGLTGLCDGQRCVNRRVEAWARPQQQAEQGAWGRTASTPHACWVCTACFKVSMSLAFLMLPAASALGHEHILFRPDWCISFLPGRPERAASGGPAGFRVQALWTRRLDVRWHALGSGFAKRGCYKGAVAGVGCCLHVIPQL